MRLRHSWKYVQFLGDLKYTRNIFSATITIHLQRKTFGYVQCSEAPSIEHFHGLLDVPVWLARLTMNSFAPIIQRFSKTTSWFHGYDKTYKLNLCQMFKTTTPPLAPNYTTSFLFAKYCQRSRNRSFASTINTTQKETQKEWFRNKLWFERNRNITLQ